MSITQKLIEIQNEVDKRENERRAALTAIADKLSRTTVGNKEALMTHVRKISDLLATADAEFHAMAKTIGSLGQSLLDIDAEIRSHTVTEVDSGPGNEKVESLRIRKAQKVSA